MKKGAQMEFDAAKEYSQCANVNYSPCGLVIHLEEMMQLTVEGEMLNLFAKSLSLRPAEINGLQRLPLVRVLQIKNTK